MHQNESQAPAAKELHDLPDFVQLLIQAGNRGPSPDNSQPLCFSWSDPGRLTIFFDPKRCTDADYFGPGSHASLLTLGAAAENIQQVATAAGFEPSWSWSEREGVKQIEIKLAATDPSFSQELWNHPVFSRHTNRLPFASTPVEAELLQSIVDLKSDCIQVLTSQEESTRQQWIQLVNSASELRFQTRDTHEWLARSLRFSQTDVEKGDGLDVATLALPPGGKYFLKLISDWSRMARLNKVGIYRLMAWIEAQALKQSPMILAIAGPNNTQEEACEAGRMMEKVWLQLNANGIAVQPYYVITDQLVRLEQDKTPPALDSAARRLADQAGSSFDQLFPHILLRIGYPKADPTRSKRYPLDKVYSPLSR
ncbi:hypothetical protein DV711_04195 [Motiliproteus coralliicola]|uniref:Nitroreductase n=1 Tax=Motiliproteus coralliicola TaxID=2283196 RepID=A0A369WT82_9GAMM|nr:nitroreductase family protein [Motiliproteus coralliicola]RDE24791.1 hypothetical protein DV711_04195 [Motiliproteus coralliicola]